MNLVYFGDRVLECNHMHTTLAKVREFISLQQLLINPCEEDRGYHKNVQNWLLKAKKVQYLMK